MKDLTIATFISNNEEYNKNFFEFIEYIQKEFDIEVIIFTDKKIKNINQNFKQTVKNKTTKYKRIIQLIKLSEANNILCIDNDITINYDNFKAFIKEFINSEYDIGWGKIKTTNINKFIGTQEEINSEKVILALPFYTRVWKKKNGELDNIAVAMKDIQDVIPSNASIEWDDELKQYYIQYNQNGATYMLWSEDEKSLEAKLSLIDKYNLAGAAYWQKDMETSNIWKIISEKLGIN